MIDKIMTWLGKMLKWSMASTDNSITEIALKMPQDEKPEDNLTPVVETPTEANNGQKEVLLWATPKQAWHSTRVLCDEAGLTYDQKNEICATIYGESEFNIKARNYNKNSKGSITSTDYSLCQINDHYHIGKGKTFPSVEYVLNNHDKVVQWMIKMYKQGNIDWWIAHKNGSYLRWIPKTSKMWKLQA